MLYVHSRHKGTGQIHLLKNLSVSDALYGIYLLIIAIANVYYGSRYRIHEYSWRVGLVCKVAALFSMLPTLVSSYLINLITLERLQVILFPLKNMQWGRKKSVLLTLSGWFFFTSEVVLHIYTSMSEIAGHSLLSNGMCHLVAFSRLSGSVDGFAVLAALYLTATTGATIVMYVLLVYNLYLQKKAMAGKATTSQQTKVSQISMRAFLIVFTDLISRIPLVFLNILSQSGLHIAPMVSVSIVIVIVPLNSAINPIVYTFTTAAFKEYLTTKLQRKVTQPLIKMKIIAKPDKNLNSASYSYQYNSSSYQTGKSYLSMSR